MNFNKESVVSTAIETVKVIYRLSWQFGLILYTIIVVNDSFVYYRTPKILRVSIENLLHQKYQTLPKDQKDVLTDMVKRKDCAQTLTCNLEVSALSHQGAVDYYHFSNKRNIIGAYLYPHPLTVWLLNLRLFIPFILLFLSKHFFTWFFRLKKKD